jgi:hypothetical protein
MKNRYSIYIISSFDYDVCVITKLLKQPHYDAIHTDFSNYLDL